MKSSTECTLATAHALAMFNRGVNLNDIARVIDGNYSVTATVAALEILGFTMDGNEEAAQEQADFDSSVGCIKLSDLDVAEEDLDIDVPSVQSR